MKSILSVAILLLLSPCTEQVDAFRLVQRSHHGQRAHTHVHKRNGSEDVNPDDADITDGPIKNENDVAVYQDTFMNDGQNVQKLNKQAEADKEKRIACDGQACITPLDSENLTPNLSKAYAQFEKTQEAIPLPKPVAPPSKQQQRIMYAQEHPARLVDSKSIAQLDSDSQATRDNTNRWASSRGVEIGEIETVQTGSGSGNAFMSVTDANNMLHAVVQSSEQDSFDQAHPQLLQRSEEEIHKELITQAEEVDTQIDVLEHQEFSSKDLNAFTAMTQKGAEVNHPEPAQPQAPAAAPAQPKGFYEQLLAKTN